MQAEIKRWVDDAACANHPTVPAEKWVELPRGGHAALEVVQVCLDECPVWVFCERHATENEEWGIWAGKSHLERYGRNPRHQESAIRAPRRRMDDEEETA